MGRIEETIARLQARRTVEGRSTSAETNAPAVAAGNDGTVAPVGHHYGGRRVDVSLNQLRARGLLAAESEDRRLMEEYRAIKRPLLKNASPALVPHLPRGNLLLVTSALPGEGKTFTSLNLCLSLAREQDWSVVLVDADCNKPHLSRLFGVERERGLMDVLRDSRVSFDSVVMPTTLPGLSLVSAGTRHDDSVELLASNAMDALCTAISAADTKRMIVFDSPPLLLTSEAPALATQLSQVVLVVRANRTPRKAVLAALDRLDPSRAISLLLNQAGKAEMGQYGAGSYGYGEKT